MVNEQTVQAANALGAKLLSRTPTAISARYDRCIGRVVIELSSGLTVMFRPYNVQGLESAKSRDLAQIEISPRAWGCTSRLLTLISTYRLCSKAS